MIDWEDFTQKEKLDQLHDDLVELESRVNTIGQTYISMGKLRERGSNIPGFMKDGELVPPVTRCNDRVVGADMNWGDGL